MWKNAIILLTCVITKVQVSDLDSDKLTNPGKIRSAGQKYDASVPDTLDLAERARLLINNLTQCPWDIVVAHDNLKAKLDAPHPHFRTISHLRESEAARHDRVAV